MCVNLSKNQKYLRNVQETELILFDVLFPKQLK